MIASIRDNLIIEETIHLQLEHSPKDLEYIGRLRKALQILFHFTRKTNSNKVQFKFTKKHLFSK